MPCGDTFLALVKSGLALALGEKGDVRYNEYGLCCDHAAGLRVARHRSPSSCPLDIRVRRSTTFLRHFGAKTLPPATGSWRIPPRT